MRGVCLLLAVVALLLVSVSESSCRRVLASDDDALLHFEPAVQEQLQVLQEHLNELEEFDQQLTLMEMEQRAEEEMELETETDSEADSEADAELDSESEEEMDDFAMALTELSTDLDMEAEGGAEAETETETEAELDSSPNFVLDSDSTPTVLEAEVVERMEALTPEQQQALLEMQAAAEAEAEIEPIIDNTSALGSSGTVRPEFDAKVYKHRPKLVASLEVDPIVVEPPAPVEGAQTFVGNPLTTPPPRTPSNADMGNSGVVRPIVNTTDFPKLPKLDPTLTVDAPIIPTEEAPVTQDVFEADVLERPHKHAQPALLETEGKPVLPIVDNSGSLAGTPRANLTQYKLKPKIEEPASFRQDLGIAAVEAQDEANAALIAELKSKPITLGAVNMLELGVEVEADAEAEATPASAARQAKKKKSGAAVIIDGTGSLGTEAPKADLKKYKVAPKIVAALVQDFNLAVGQALDEAANLQAILRI